MHNIWDYWAGKYDKLWVQKYSLKPTRDYIINALSKYINKDNLKVLDLGCGTGELILELTKRFENIGITGIDFSEKMIEISKKRNPKALHLNMDVTNLSVLDDEYDIIICTHSLPYYKKPKDVIRQLYNLLSDKGELLIGFASGNSTYDKFILSFVKLTTGKAYYPSDNEFRIMTAPFFTVENLNIIKKKFFMPRIAVYTLKKVKS
ncbi:MAG TPA: class I SAM-dependent methyltransferase [Sedimentibacter sp.]|nr:class I SAM-dependent methyltransferase [Sedimentibacter sp.]HNZ82732.1 class I SAM-dependent methyltransferase [Sedimentibacter sp.]HOH69509.1 class I SAM-dependent methyltransferase [Sedimentibacter sp.]HPW99330.1 class I SAM-dependent methyltransferase [Sedimentibacter sp.]HQB62983.1 class I SAM-dependent methyltransferase [Sedimentibacter sp.]